MLLATLLCTLIPSPASNTTFASPPITAKDESLIIGVLCVMFTRFPVDVSLKTVFALT